MSRADEPVTGFPIPAHPGEGSQHAWTHKGLTIREHFAGLAMQAVMGRDSGYPDNTAEWAVRYADALIAELAKVKP